MLPFHDAIHEEAASSDSLHIIARGLGMHHAFAKLVLRSVAPDTLVLAVNVSRQLAAALVHPALAAQTHPANAPLLLPRFLSADYTVRDRAAVYAAAGFVVVTSAVLVHDLLHGALPAHRVAGLVIFAADQIKERSNHHFALNLFRHRNRTAFIKAFSENPVALSTGFHRVEKLMRLLYVSRLCLWPRFHARVRDSLKHHVPDLVDLSVQPTARTAALLSALREVIHAILHDLKLATSAVDYSELYRETTPTDDAPARKLLVPNFDDVVRRQMDGASMRTSKVRALMSDLTTLRHLLRDVFECNPVAFYQRVVTVRATVTHGANWLVRKEAQRAVLLARSRVWQLRRPEGASADAPARTVPTLEKPPKWQALRDVLREIAADVETAGAEADVGRVLVLVREERTLEELNDVLRLGGHAVLKQQFQSVFPSVAARASEVESLRQITMTQLALPEEERRPLEPDKPYVKRKKAPKRPRSAWSPDAAREELLDVFHEVKSECDTRIEVLLWCVEWVDLQGRGHRVLEEYRPAFVILYNADLATVRQVEVYKASQPGRPVRLYILAYDDAVEDERFRQASGREKAAFKTLIRERATMTVLVNQEGRQPEEEFTQSLLETVDAAFPSSRRGLGADRDSRLFAATSARKAKRPGGKVLVDTRELRSSLPMLLYQSSLTIVPLTLEVGDFILSKNIGIERKSVPDLYGSFGSGRLFNQAEALCRHYKYPCLLIELDEGKPLSLTATSGGVPQELLATSIVSKMVLLIQQFPSFRLLWAKGPHDAAEMFAALKANEDEPEVEKAASLGVDTKETGDEDFSAGPKALLRSLPGIDSHNIMRIMRSVRDVATLITMSMEEMTEVLGSAGKATALYDFVNEEPSEALAAL